MNVLFLRNAARLGMFAALICVTMRGGRAQEISPEGRRHFTAARRAQDAQDFEAAAREYLATIRLQPGFAGAYNNLGLIYYVQGRFRESAEVLGKGVRLDPKFVGANLYLGIAYVKLNHPEKALPFLQRAAQLDAGNKEAQSWLGTAYWESGQTWVALEQLRKADKDFPNDPDIMFVLGEAYRKTADQELESVIQHASGTAFVHQIFGDIYLDQGALQKAKGHYERALGENAQAANIHFELGEAALLSGDVEGARAEYAKQPGAAGEARLGEIALLDDRVAEGLRLLGEAVALSALDTVSALRLPPSYATATERLSEKVARRFDGVLPELMGQAASPARELAVATIAAALNQPENFEKAWTSFEAAMPHTPAADTLKGRAQQDFERQAYDRAEAEIHAWLAGHAGKRDSESQDSEYLEAEYLAARCHRLLSLEVLNQLLSAFPEAYRSHQLLAQTYEQRDEDEKAVEEYKKVEELSPGLPGVHFALGRLLVKDGDLEQASVQLKQELQLNPEHAEANAEMGMVLLTQGEGLAAIDYLTRAIALQPDLWLAHQELGKAYFQQKRYDVAKKELMLALADDPEGVAHYQLGLVYKATDQSQEANREFALSRKIKSDRLAQLKIEMPAGAKDE